MVRPVVGQQGAGQQRIATIAPARPTPHNIEAEQAVLGALIMHNELYETMSALIDVECFFEPLHARIWGRCGDLLRKGRVVTPTTLVSALGEDPALLELGGQAYLNRLAAAGLSVISPRDYTQIVHDLAVRRQLIGVSDRMRETAYDTGNDVAPDEQIVQAEGELYDLAERGRAETGFEPFAVAARKAVDIATKAFRKSGHIGGLASGLRDLDHKLGGFFPSDLIILAGRPGMGKTSLATNIAFNIARAYRRGRDENGAESTLDGGVVGFFSLEMSSEQLALRILSEQAEVSSQKIRKGQVNEDEFRRITAACTDLEGIPLVIDQTGAISISMLGARARRLKRRLGLELIVIDYLQLMTTSGKKKTDNRVQEITEITMGLKALAKELEVPVLALSQLSRAVEQRDNKRPMLSDLRESGSIEQDADVVMFVYREEYYLKAQEPPPGTPEWMDWMKKAEPVHGMAEVLIEKHRHGPTGSVQLAFASEFTRFGNLERSPYEIR